MAHVQQFAPPCMWDNKNGFDPDTEGTVRGALCGGHSAFRIDGDFKDSDFKYYVCGHHAEIARAEGLTTLSLEPSDIQSSRQK